LIIIIISFAQKHSRKQGNTCIAPQAAYRSCRGAVHVTDRAGLWPIGRRLSQRPQADLWPTAIRSLVCRLMVSTPVSHVIAWITTHLPTPEGWKAELAWLVDPYGRLTHEVVTRQP